MRKTLVSILIFIVVNTFLASSSFSQEASSYQEEFVFLKNQLQAIKSRKSKTVKQLKEIEANLIAKNTKINKSVAKLSAETDILKTKLSTFDEVRSSKEFSEKKMNVVAAQMKEAAVKYSIKGESFNEINDSLIEYLYKGASLYKKEQKSFNRKGIEVIGKTLNLGHTVSFFDNKNSYISLIESKNKESRYFGGVEVNSDKLKAGGVILLPLEFKDGSISVKKTFSSVFSEKLEAGGAVGYIIILLGLVGLVIAFLRYGTLRVYSQFNESAIREIVKKVQSGDIEAAKEKLYKQKTDPITYFIDTLFLNFHKKDEVYESIVIDEIAKVQSKVSKYGPYLIVLAAVAPLLGLLGTVTGMIGTFEMITVHGTGNPKLLSGGIKEALVTTQMGLIVAIPCILAGNFLSSKASKIIGKYEEVASAIPKV